MGVSYLASAASMSGDLQAAHELYQTALRYAHECGLEEGTVSAKANIGMGQLYYEWNRSDAALQYLAQGIRLAEHGGYLEQLLPAYVSLMHAQLQQGHTRGAQESMDRLRKIVAKYGDPPIGLAFLDAAKADIALQENKSTIADRWANRYRPPIQKENTLFSEYEQLVFARVWRHQNDDPRMCELIEPLRHLAEIQGRISATISYDVMVARCRFMNGEAELALTILEDALALAEPGQFVRTFLDEGGVVVSMIKQLLTAYLPSDGAKPKVSPAYLHLLLNEAAKAKGGPSSIPPDGKDANVLELLTGQEFRILQLVEAGCSNMQIAQELSVSVNTVKYHLKNIYGKIGVENRMQASRAFRERA